MAIPEPIFDSRNYREILNEALARIPVHNPEWTNFNDADPGITLLQLFAFMSEGIIYRANRIPDRNRKKFLRLLGEAVRAPAAAVGLVSFTNPRGELKPILLTGDQEVLAGNIPFRTTNALQILPVEARVYYKHPLSAAQSRDAEALYRLYASFELEQGELSFYETRQLNAPQAGAALPVVDLAIRDGSSTAQAGVPRQVLSDTVDGALWLAIFARSAEDPAIAREVIANQVLTLGVVPAAASDGCLLPAEGENRAEGLGLVFETPNTDVGPNQRPLDRYRPLEARSQINLLLNPGVVELTLPDADQLGFWDDLDPEEAGTGNFPPSLAETEDEARLITWIRIRPAADASDADSRGQQARFSWLGVNAAKVIQRAQVAAEQLPNGTGEPNQNVMLTQTPVILDSVQLSVNGELWQQIDDLAAAPPEVTRQSSFMPADTPATAPTSQATETDKVFTVERESGEICFGDGIHGARPPFGARIQASYAYGGGAEGMVGIGAINRGPQLPSGVKVMNPLPTYGGDRGETLAEAERRIPTFLHHRDRLVSPRDFRDITWRTPGVELGRVEVLPLFHPDQNVQLSRGVVTVLVIPSADPIHPRSPQPDRLFLETICNYLAPRRLLTTEIHVRGPVYQDIWVSIGIDIVPGREQAPVLEAVKMAIEAFLSPLTGGFEREGWPLEKTVESAEISAMATRVSGVAKIVGLYLGDATGTARESITLTGLELPRLRAVAVSSGEPATLQELLGTAGGPTTAGELPGTGDGTGGTTPAGRQPFPVPVAPEGC